MKVILTEKQYKEYLRFLQDEHNHNCIMEEFKAELSQKDMPAEFQQMNDYIYGDVPQSKLDAIQKHYTKNGFTYNNSAKHPELGQHNAEVKPNISGSVFPFGNIKLSHEVLIVNLTSALHCPSAKFCPIGKNACYAFNDERRRESYWQRNARNEIMFDMARENPAKWKYIFWFIRSYIDKARNAGVIVRYVRLNEAGDFKTAEDVRRFDEFAAELKKDYGIETHAYTANKDLIDAISQVKNININASIPDIQGEKVLRHFYGVDEDILADLPDTPLRDIATPELQEGGRWGLYYKCPCDIAAGAKCFNCQVCWLAKPGIAPNGEEVPQFNVLCKIHGAGKKHYNPNIADKRRGMTPEEQKKNIKKMVQQARRAEQEGNE